MEGDKAVSQAHLNAFHLVLKPIRNFSEDACEDAIGCAIFQDITLGLALADMDDDGDLDIITANMGSPSRLYLNDGFGRFPPFNYLK